MLLPEEVMAVNSSKDTELDFIGMAPEGKESDEEMEKFERMKKKVGLSRGNVGADEPIKPNVKDPNGKADKEENTAGGKEPKDGKEKDQEPECECDFCTYEQARAMGYSHIEALYISKGYTIRNGEVWDPSGYKMRDMSGFEYFAKMVSTAWIGPLKSLTGFINFKTATKTSTTVLEGAVKSNYGRFVKDMPVNAKSSSSWKLLDYGNYLFEATSPATNIPGSKAVYQKWVNAQGETFKMLKTTYAPDDSVVHIKPKF